MVQSLLAEVQRVAVSQEAERFGAPVRAVRELVGSGVGMREVLGIPLSAHMEPTSQVRGPRVSWL